MANRQSRFAKLLPREQVALAYRPWDFSPVDSLTARAVFAVPSTLTGFCPVREVIRSKYGLIGQVDPPGFEPGKLYRSIRRSGATRYVQ